MSSAKKFIMLSDANPEVARQWHPTKNGDLTPDKVSAGSHNFAWWLGDCGHEWEGIIRSRANKGAGCIYCIGKKVLLGFNDLETINPEVARQWHPTKNGEDSPKNYTLRSNTKAWWQCDKGHEWEAPISYRTGKRGGGCSYCLNQKVMEGYNDLESLLPELASEWNTAKNGILTAKQVSVGSDKKVWWTCSEGHEWKANITDRNGKKSGCPVCITGYQISQPEKEIVSYLESILPDVEIKTTDKTVINPFEIDIYIPAKKIAIEYNGLYWHSEKNRKGKDYHYNKFVACKEQGIQLIQIFEDDYKRSPSLVKNMLAHKLGVSQQEKVFARKTNVAALTKTQADDFLNANHIQGSVDARLRYGLFDGEQLVSVMLLKSESGTNSKTLNLIRYATSKNVVGGFTKLLSYVEKENPLAIEMVTFSDNTVSNGGLYINNGFIQVGMVKPDYMYIVSGKRAHKFGYRLKNFKNNPNLIWIEGYTEKQLAKENNLLRIWDAGKVKYSKKINQK